MIVRIGEIAQNLLSILLNHLALSLINGRKFVERSKKRVKRFQGLSVVFAELAGGGMAGGSRRKT